MQEMIGLTDTVSRTIIERIRQTDAALLPPGLTNGRTGLMLLEAMAYMITEDCSLLDRAQRNLSELLCAFESNIFSSDRSFRNGALGFIWAVTKLIDWNMLDDDPKLRGRLSRILNFRSPINDSPIRFDTDDIVYGEGLAILSMWTADESLASYRICEELIRRIDDVEDLMDFSDEDILSLNLLSPGFIYSLFYFIDRLHHKKVYPYKTSRLLPRLWPLFIRAYSDCRQISVEQISRMGLFSVIFSDNNLVKDFSVLVSGDKGLTGDRDWEGLSMEDFIGIASGLLYREISMLLEKN